MLYLRILLSEVGGPKSISWTEYTTVTSSVTYVTFTSNGSRVGNVSSLWVRSGATLDSIAASLFVLNWLSWQIVSDDKIQITILILRRGALSMLHPSRIVFLLNEEI